MQRVGTDRGIGKSEPLKPVLIIVKILLESVTEMKFLEYGFVLQDEPNICLCYRKRESLHTFVMVHWTCVSVTYLVPAVQHRGTTKKFSEFHSSK